jgi:hypothetical protein
MLFYLFLVPQAPEKDKKAFYERKKIAYEEAR